METDLLDGANRFQKRLLKYPLRSVYCAAIQSHGSLRIREFFLCIQGIRRLASLESETSADDSLRMLTANSSEFVNFLEIFLIFWIICSSLLTLQILFGFPSEIHKPSGSPDITPIFVIFLDEENEQLTMQTCSATITTRVPIQRRLKIKHVKNRIQTEHKRTRGCVEEAIS